MSARRITGEVWDALLAAFREVPGGNQGAYAAAARAAGVDARTARRAWEQGLRGWPRPIRELVAEEQAEARAEVARQQREEASAAGKARQEARGQAVSARKQEGLMVSMSRNSAMRLVAATAEALQEVQLLAERARSKLSELLREDDEARADPSRVCRACGRPATMHPGEATGLIAAMTAQAKRTVEVVEQVMKLERLHLGQPTEISELQVRGEGITLQDGIDRLSAATAALESAARRGVLPGGAQKPPAREQN